MCINCGPHQDEDGGDHGGRLIDFEPMDPTDAELRRIVETNRRLSEGEEPGAFRP